jgi:SRSO17 transposase
MKNHNNNNECKNGGLGLNLGDKIQVWAGAEQIAGDGSFIKFDNNTLVWADDIGNIRYQFVGPEISIVKI